MISLHLIDGIFLFFPRFPTLFTDKTYMAQNDEYLLNEEITENKISEYIIELNNLDPKREEQTRNSLITVGNRVIRNYDGPQRIDSGR